MISQRYFPCWQQLVFALCMVGLVLHDAQCFTISMNYKPPVKSSVSKIRNPRLQRSDGPSADHQNSRSSTSKSAYAGAISPTRRPNSFEKRMRDLVLGPQRQSPDAAAPVAPNKLPPNVKVIDTLQQYSKIIGDQQDKVVAVRFFSHYCRACRAVTPMFYRLANQHKDVVFLDIPATTSNANLHQGLGVPSLPYAHIYDPKEGLVEELRLTRQLVPEFTQKLQDCIDANSKQQQEAEDL